MYEKVLNKYGVAQIGYYVESIEETAELLKRAFGAGPFVDIGVNPPKSCKFRGEEIELLQRCALGHLNNVQIELIEVHSEAGGPYKEMGRYGLHHLCIWVDDVDAAVADLAAEGFEVAMEMEAGSGLRVVYVDCRDALGTYIEVNAPIESLWQGVKAASMAWDGEKAVIGMAELAASLGR